MHTLASLARCALIGACSILLWAPAVAADQEAGPSERAVELYDLGRYPEARPLLEELDAAGQATGPLLYRLAYCQRVGGDAQLSARTQQRAMEALEKAGPSSGDLEVSFYLVNTYRNLGREADAEKTAAQTIDRLEAGKQPVPTTGVGMFQVGKLYADAGKADKAAEWYGKAVEALSAEESPNEAYLNWANRYLAQRAEEKGATEDAARHYSRLLADGKGSFAEYDRLAVAAVRAGDYTTAAEAWERSVQLEPAEANRSRYCAKLAELAAQVGDLPERTPSGRFWAVLTKDELAAVMRDQVTAARLALEEFRTTPQFTKAELSALGARKHEAKSLFVAAALEYGIKRYGIREEAFFNGYANMILKPKNWKFGSAAERNSKLVSTTEE